MFKFLNQCFARLRCWKKCLEFTKPTCWIHFSKTEVVQNTDLNILALYQTQIKWNGKKSKIKACFFQFTGIENNLLHYLTLYSIVAETRCHVIYYERVKNELLEIKLKLFQ